MWDPQYGMFLLVGSEIQEIIVCGICNTGNFCLWDLKYGKFLLVGSGIRGNFCLWDPEYRKFLFVGSANTGCFCLWNLNYRKFLFVGSAYGKFYFCGIQNRGVGISNSSSRNPETPLTTEIRNSSFTDKKSGTKYLESGIHSAESRIQDLDSCLSCGRATSFRMIETYVYVQAEKNFKEHIDCKTAGFFFFSQNE